MKIAVWYNLHSGGAKRALYYHVQGLVERGHEVEVWCPPTADRDYLPLRDLACEHVVPLPTPASTGGRLQNRFLRTYSQLQAMDAHCRECARAINAGGFDLLFANSCMVSAASAIGRYVDVPGIVYLQEPARTLYEALPDLPWAALPATHGSRLSPRALRQSLSDFLLVQQMRVMMREEKTNARSFDRILVNSYFSRESILRAYGLDAQVCYLGIDTDLFQQSDTPRENMVLGVGGIVVIKNVRFVLEAIAHIPQPRPRLVWIGNIADPGYLQSLYDFADRANVDFEARVGVTNDELRDTFQRASVMACAPRLEPFGFTPLEANACGVPVVATAEGGLRETIRDGFNGLVVDADPRAMAGAIQHLLANPALAGQLGSNGRQWVSEQWSLNACVDRLEQSLLDALQCPRPAQTV